MCIMGQGGYLMADPHYQIPGTSSNMNVPYLHPMQEHADNSNDNEVAEDVQDADAAGRRNHEGNMRRSMSTTVPQSMVQHNLNCSHIPTPSSVASCRRRQQQMFSTDGSVYSALQRCCKVAMLLVVIQFCIGVAITSLAFYMQAMYSVFEIRECPFWTGIPLCLAGIFGVYHCATDFVVYSGNKKAFTIKCICFCLSILCTFVCIVAAIFPGVHTYRILTYKSCDILTSLNQQEMSDIVALEVPKVMTPPPIASSTSTTVTINQCFCVQSSDPLARLFIYKDSDNCNNLCTTVKLFLILQFTLNIAAGILSFTLVMLIWRSRYNSFYCGLKFYSYAADIPPHPWFDPTNPPYYKEQSNNTLTRARSQQLTVKQATQSLNSLHRV